ncbi:MAG: hypothetical protein WCC81_24805 [Pseudolabrys sp.]
MRRAITLILYLALIVAGLYLNLWIYQTQTDARFTALMVGIFLVLFGGYMLLSDFLSPNRDKNRERYGVAS